MIIQILSFSWFSFIWPKKFGWPFEEVSEEDLWEDIFTIGYYGSPGLTLMKCSTLKWQHEWQFGSNSFVSYKLRNKDELVRNFAHNLVFSSIFS